jgi:Protein of unknown function (DUF2523)
MIKRLFELLSLLLSGSMARVLTGAGLTLVSYAAIGPLVSTALALATSGASGMLPSVLQLCAMSGAGVAFSSVGSALIARAALASSTMGLKRAVGTTGTT